MQRIIIVFLFASYYTIAQSPIHIDQFGYLPQSEKVAVLSNPQVGYNASDSYNPSSTLDVMDANTNLVVLSATPQVWDGGNTHDQSGDAGWWLDFSSITTPGEYFIRDVANGEQSANFVINDNPYADVLKHAARSFFYNRCNMEKAAPYAESNWTDVNNFLNPLQDANCRFIYDTGNASLEKDLSGGWFDAGDYNKYVTFAHSAVHNLLASFEENQQAYGDDWNIPESGNGVPDILDEIKWELDWLMKMNNSDGSTQIKMGSVSHNENAAAPPSANFDQRYYGPTCTSASLAIASMFAHAATVYGQYASFTGYAIELESRAEASWNYVQPFILNGNLETACDDGSILAGDADWSVDEQLEVAVAASMHLFELTGDSDYHDYFLDNYAGTEQVTSAFWAAYKTVLNDALLRYTTLPGNNATASANIISSIELDVSNNWNGYYGFNDDDLYRAYMPNWSYHWGSNMPKANYGNLNQALIKYNILPAQHDDFEQQVQEIAHYFHGVNPQDIVYLSNMYDAGAERSCNEIYHTWFADGSDWDNALTSLYGPAPGFLSGGPNKDFSITTMTPPSGQPSQKSYLDFNTGWPDNSWEITEPAIYYQAAYVRLLANLVNNSGLSSAENIMTTENCIEVYPNPINQYFVMTGELADYNIDLLDSNGQVVNNLNTLGNEVIVETSTLGPGLFFIRVQHTVTNELSVQKIIKGF